MLESESGTGRSGIVELAVETAALRKSFGGKLAVADLTLRVPRGEVFGFLGPNGAGKSTAVKMLLGLIRPDGGEGRVLGRRPGDVSAKQRIGFLPEHFRFHEWLQAAEFLDFHARLFGLSTSERRRRIPELLEVVGLAQQSRLLLSGFSKGMLQRIGLAQALMNEPELLVLDEPTSALDPLGRIMVREVLRDQRARGTTVFLNSHLLSEVEATCDRVCFIREGRVLRTLSLSEVEAGRVRVRLTVDAVTPALRAALEGLGAQPLAEGDQPAARPSALDGDRPTLELSLPDEQLLPVLAERVLASGARLYALTPERLSLERLFVEVVGHDDSGR
jgi:ABC-2 type transport system ATP-binding protein